MPQWSRSALESYLSGVLGEAVACERVSPLGDCGDGDDEKAYGYGTPVRIDYRGKDSGRAGSVVFHTMKPTPFGHEHRADRAAAMLWSHDAFNTLPRHVRSLDVGGLRAADGGPVSLEGIDEFFLLTEFVEGREYAHDIERLRKGGELTDLDRARADALCDYLVEIHSRRHDRASLYHRRIRELIGDGECIMGLCDSYPPDQPVFTPAALEELERRLVAWRWRIRHRTHRLRCVHGDFHPWNILFADDAAFHLLDRSRGEWGDPADDLTCLTLNYLFESLQEHGRLVGPFAELFERFWRRYLAASGDDELPQVAAPFFVFRALVMASPVWFPQVTDDVRRRMLAFCRAVLAADSFDFERVHDYIAAT